MSSEVVGFGKGASNSPEKCQQCLTVGPDSHLLQDCFDRLSLVSFPASGGIRRIAAQIASLIRSSKHNVRLFPSFSGKDHTSADGHHT